MGKGILPRHVVRMNGRRGETFLQGDEDGVSAPSFLWETTNDRIVVFGRAAIPRTDWCRYAIGSVIGCGLSLQYGENTAFLSSFSVVGIYG